MFNVGYLPGEMVVLVTIVVTGSVGASVTFVTLPAITPIIEALSTCVCTARDTELM